MGKREKILLAARELFVAYGFSGTSIGKIAKLADVNHSLVFHYFENKSKLWAAVKEDIVAEVKAHQQIVPDTNLSFKDCLKKLFQENFKFYRTRSDVVRIINWQRLEKAEEVNIGITKSSTALAWIDALKFYQKKGDIDSDLKIEFVFTMILSLISTAALDPNVFIRSKPKEAAYIEFCVQFLVEHLKSRRKCSE